MGVPEPCLVSVTVEELSVAAFMSIENSAVTFDETLMPVEPLSGVAPVGRERACFTRTQVGRILKI